MKKQENVVLSVEALKEIFRDLFKEQEQTLLTIVSNSTKLLHQRLDKLGANIIDINEKVKKNKRKRRRRVKTKSPDVSRH